VKLALIPPTCRINDIKMTDYQLVLPDPLTRIAEYREAYDPDPDEVLRSGHQPHPRGYTILDNGVAEGTIIDPVKLLVLGRRIAADEIVLPDVLGNAWATWQAIKYFFEDSTHGDWPTNYDPNYMAVVQGKSWSETTCFVQLLSEVFDRYDIKALGLPRLLLDTIGHSARLRLAEWIKREHPRFEIHFLGASPLWPSEMKHAAALGVVRGMDTSLPYYYGVRNLSLEAWEVVSRPPDYFNQDSLYSYTGGMVSKNVREMLEWCGYDTWRPYTVG
jgi:hypothetical protein